MTVTVAATVTVTVTVTVTRIHTYIHTYPGIHTFTHTHTHTHSIVHTYTHVYIHTYSDSLVTAFVPGTGATVLIESVLDIMGYYHIIVLRQQPAVTVTPLATGVTVTVTVTDYFLILAKPGHGFGRIVP